MTCPKSIGANYVLDSNGNTLTKVVGSNTTTYAWDFENRLTSVTLPGTGGTVTFKYDPFGRRIYKSSSAGTSVYAYDGDNLVEETNAAGAVVARYSQGQNIDEPLAMLRSSTTSYYHGDGLGSVTSLSNGAGSLAQTYAYDSFGKPTSSSGSLTNPFQYTGRESDTETGLYYYRARYYDPATGRFMSEDPIGFDGGINFYRYTRKNPVNSKDPSGLVDVVPLPDANIHRQPDIDAECGTNQTLKNAKVVYFPIYHLRHVFCTRLSWVAPDAVVQHAMRHSSPETKRHYQLGMVEQVRQNLEKANDKVYGRRKVLHFYDSQPDDKKEVEMAVCK